MAPKLLVKPPGTHLLSPHYGGTVIVNAMIRFLKQIVVANTVRTRATGITSH